MRNQEAWLTSSRGTLLIAHETAIGALKSAQPSEISTKFKAEISMVYYRAKAIGLVLGLTDPLRMHNDQPLGPVEMVVSPKSSVKAPDLSNAALAQHTQHSGGTSPDAKSAADAVEKKSAAVEKDEFEKFEAKEKEDAESKAKEKEDAESKGRPPTEEVKEPEPHTPCKRPASSSDGMPPAKRAAKMLTRYIAEFSGPQSKPPPTRSYRNLIVLG